MAKKETNYKLIPLIKSSDSNTIHIFINGFMSDENDDYKAKDWQEGFKNILNPSEQKFIFKWESGTDYTVFRNHLPFQNGLDFEIKRIKHIAKAYNQISEYDIFSSKKIDFLLSLPKSLTSFIVEEWRNSHQNSIKYGKILAFEIEKLLNQDKKIHLYAHSLGTNLVKNSLIDLANKNMNIEKVSLFGGATSNGDLNIWKDISQTTKNGIHNFYSRNDDILKYLFKTFEDGITPIGLEKIKINSKNIHNYDTTNVIKGHSDYKKELAKIIL